MKNFPIFIVSLCVTVVQATNVLSQPLETAHYRIEYDTHWLHASPAPGETAIILEQFYRIMDTHFGIPMAKEFAKAQQNHAGDEPDTKKPRKTVPYQVKTGPKYTVYFMNDGERFFEKLIEKGVSTSKTSGGLCDDDQKAIFLYRQPSLESTRQTLIHEAIHAYHYNVFPGNFDGYPQWFQEALAESLDDHTWNGKNLRIGIMPPFVHGGKRHAIPVLFEFRDWINEKKAGIAATHKPGETVIEYNMIDEFVSEHINYQRGDDESGDNEIIDKAYTLYWVLGKFLFLGRRDALNAILWEICTDPELAANPENAQTTTSFFRAWQKAFEKKPLTIEGIHRWLMDNPIAWEIAFSEWQFTGNSFNAFSRGAALLVFWKEGVIPPFIARPETPGCAVGIAVNYFDKDNYSIIRVHENGNVAFCVRRNGVWSSVTNIGTFRRNSNLPLPREYFFGVKRNGPMIGVFINDQLFYEMESPPWLRMGMLLEGENCEANFFPR